MDLVMVSGSVLVLFVLRRWLRPASPVQLDHAHGRCGRWHRALGHVAAWWRVGDADEFQDSLPVFSTVLVTDWEYDAAEPSVRENDEVFTLVVSAIVGARLRFTFQPCVRDDSGYRGRCCGHSTSACLAFPRWPSSMSRARYSTHPADLVEVIPTKRHRFTPVAQRGSAGFSPAPGVQRLYEKMNL